MKTLILLLLSLMPTLAWGQIIAPEAVDEHQPITVRSDGDADVYLWRVSKPAARRVVLNGKGCHIWAPPGEYTVELTTITISIDWENKSKDIQYDEYVHVLTVGDGTPDPGPDPPDPPDPEPTPNPYSPDPEFQPKASPVTAMVLEPVDAKQLAAMYAVVSSQVKAGAFNNLGQVRSELVQRGTELSLQGKYTGLATAVEQFLTQTVGLEREVASERAGRALDTLAWAIYETGRGQ